MVTFHSSQSGQWESYKSYTDERKDLDRGEWVRNERHNRVMRQTSSGEQGLGFHDLHLARTNKVVELVFIMVIVAIWETPICQSPVCGAVRDKTYVLYVVVRLALSIKRFSFFSSFSNQNWNHATSP